MNRRIQDVRVFISRDLPAIAAASLREAGFDLTARPTDDPLPQAELIEVSKKNHALLCIVSDKIDAHFLNECKHLEIISQFGVGYDNINIPEATRLGIPVGNTPGAMSDATADVAFGLMINVSRKMFYMHKTIAAGKWSYFRPKANLGFELKNKTLGIFGMGRIGMEMAMRCRGAYNMKVIYHNRTRNTEAEKTLGATWVSFDNLLSQSDILSVHSVLSEETKGLFDRTAFRKMKRSSVFINTSRGLVHNEIDLIASLQAGEIWGAGLDVTNPEPMKPDNPLLSMENVAILPHIGSATEEARSEMGRLAALNIIEFYKNGRIPHLVNPEYVR
jgi:glyoxylate reductase